MNEEEEFEFRARAEREAAPAAPRQAPGSQPLPSWSDRMQSSGLNLARGLLTGGPTGLITAGGKEALQGLGDITNRGAYKAGGAVTDVLSPHVPPEVAGGAGYLANVGVQAIPTALGAAMGRASESTRSEERRVGKECRSRW